MIDTNAIRIKVVDVAVIGELTSGYISKSNASNDLKSVGIIPEEISADEIPYELKKGWKWVRVVDLGADTKNSFADGPFGSNLKREHYTLDKQVRIIQLSNVGELGWKDENEKYTTYKHLETIKRSEVKTGDIVIAKMMPAGRAIIVPNVSQAYVLSSDCVKFVPNKGLNARYLCHAINSQMFRKQVLHDVHGIGRERTSLSKLKSYLLPIPPVDEQDVIVKKIDAIFELLKTIDILQAKYRNDLDVLKNKIIDAGIQGKLTEQIPSDGDAEDLYVKILKEKNAIIDMRGGRKDASIKIDDEVKPFEIPDNWKWIRFGEVGLFKKGPFGSALTKSIFVPKSDKAVKVYEQQNAIKKDASLGTYYITREYFESYMKGFEVRGGDILVSCAGTIGETYIMPEKIEQGIINQALMRVTLVDSILDEFFMYYFDSNLKASARNESNGMAIKNIPPFDVMKNWFFPLPPFEEQKRIVLAIDKALSIIS